MQEAVEFYSLERVPNGSGGFNPNETLLFRTFAEVKNERAKQSIEAGQLVPVTSRKVKVYKAKEREITIDMKMKWKGKTYLISSIDEDERGVYYWLTVTRAK